MPASSFDEPGLRVVWRASPERSEADRLLAELVTSFLGARGASGVHIGRRCPRCGSTAHGRPVVEGAGVSLSRAHGLAVAAVSTRGEVGVDVEPAGRADFDGFGSVARHPDEEPTDATRTWVRKEALLKAAGWGLAVDPRDVRLDADGGLAAWPDHLPDPSRSWSRDLPLPPGYVGSVAVIGSR